MAETKMKVNWVNVANDVYEDKFNALCEALEQGDLVHIYVDCIGHTRAIWVEAAYVDKLKQKYEERFVEADHGGWERAYCLLNPDKEVEHG